MRLSPSPWLTTLLVALVPSLVFGQFETEVGSSPKPPSSPIPAGKCTPSDSGAPCNSARGYDGICRMSPQQMYGCWEKACDGPRAQTTCTACGVSSICGYTDIGDRVCRDSPRVGQSCDRDTTCSATGICQAGGGVKSDPIITGFDGKSFHFDQAGEFTLLSSGDGFRVDVTFAGATTEAKDEKSWTSSVRFIAPNGDMVACALPAIQPNTSRVQVTAMPAQSPSEVALLAFGNPSVELAEMTATAVLSESGQVTGCQVITSNMQTTVYQVSGDEQAMLHAEEAWAAPYTWLNTDVKLLKPLPAPVTGILGGTCPVDMDTEAEFLRALEEPGGVEAAVIGEPGSRRLAGVASPIFLQSSIVGLSKA